MNPIQYFLFGISLLLSGCSMLGLERVWPQSRMTQSQVQPNQQLAPPQTFKLSLLGGNELNMSGDGVARPVQVCIYVVRNRDWEAPFARRQSTCVELSADTNLLFSKRLVLAPLHMHQITLPMESGLNTWLIIEADYSQSTADDFPFILPMNSQNNQLSVMLNGNTLFFNPLAGPETINATQRTTSSQHTTSSLPSPSSQNASSSELKRFKPLIRQSVMNPSSINVRQQGQGLIWEEISNTLEGRK